VEVGKWVAPTGKGVGASVLPTISHTDIGCARQTLSGPYP
jgi:hypothetical protein